jgi:hypothetical protein
MLIGQSIRPELFVNDYSGFANAGAIKGQATAQLGKDIAGAVAGGADIYKGMKEYEGKTNAFGKSMDAMAKAFPEQAEMFNSAKMDVMDPNASLIERVSRMNQSLETLKMAQAQQMLNAQSQYYGARASQAQAGAGSSAANSTTATDNVFGLKN